MKKIPVVALSILLLCVGYSGCINQAEERNQKLSQLLTVGIAEGPYGFFPWITSYDSNTLAINFNIFNPLVSFDNSFKLFPKLAKSWNNPDNCTWRFFLRNDVTFHNGYNFTAHDVKYTIDLIKDNSSHVLRDLLTDVQDVHVVDNYTVDIVTYQPFPVLLNKLTNIPIASQKYGEEASEKWPIGTGAYKLDEYVPGDHITLVRFDEYSMGAPVIKKVMYKIIQDTEDRKNAVIARDIDIMEHFPQMYIDEILNTSGITVKKISNPTVWYLGFDFRQNNSSGFPGTNNPLADVRVRKAIYHAIDIGRLIKLLNLSAEPASQILSPLIFGFNPAIKRLPFDLNLSRQLLRDAGYENGFNVTLDTIEGSPLQVQLCEEIAKQLSPILHVNVTPLPIQEFIHKVSTGNCSFYFLGWIPATGDGGEIFDYLLRSESHPLGMGSCNFGFYSNETIDKLTTEISTTMNQKKRLELMKQAFTVAMDDVACIPLYIDVCIVAFPDYLEWRPRSDLNLLVEEITVK